MGDLPLIKFALPLDSESRWSDMLAVLIASDPKPFGSLIGVNLDPQKLSINREVKIDNRSRLDIRLKLDQQTAAVVEVKVLASLGRAQLSRYQEAEPNALAYVVIYPDRLAISLAAESAWRLLTWEQILTSYRSSRHAWVVLR